MTNLHGLKKCLRWLQGRRATVPVSPRARLALEALEDRQVPSTVPVLGTFNPRTGMWAVRPSMETAAPNSTFTFGKNGLTPLAGDWNGDGLASVGTYDAAHTLFSLRNSNSAGAADVSFSFGQPGWLPITGDWNGDGVDTVGMYDPRTATFYLRNSNSSGAADVTFTFGATGKLPVVGDWNGDKIDTIGVVDTRTATWSLRNSNSAGAADATFVYGKPGWSPVVGDWNGDGIDTVGMVKSGLVTQWVLRNSNSAGPADVSSLSYGLGGWRPVVFPGAIKDTTPPVVSLTGGASSASGFDVTVTATDGGSGLQGSLHLDVDLNHDGDFTDVGERDYQTSTLAGQGTAGVSVFGLPTGSFDVQAHVVDKNGNEGASSVQSLSVAEPVRMGLPVSFEVNQGQTDSRAQYVMHAGESVVFLTSAGFVLTGKNPNYVPSPVFSMPSKYALQIQVLGADMSHPVAETPLPGIANYFIGNDASKWRTNIPTYGAVRYPNAYAGIDLVSGSDAGRWGYHFVVNPGADPRAIQLNLVGARGIAVDAKGQLIFDTINGPDLTQSSVVMYQESAAGLVAVRGRYVVQGTRVSFDVTGYNASKPLIIDPYVFNTFLGGTDLDATPVIKADASGSAYVTCLTFSVDFPTVNPLPTGGTNAGVTDVAVSKLDPTGTTLIYSTYLGGTDFDEVYGINVDASASAYVTGGSISTDFPVTAGVVGGTMNGVEDAFIAKLAPLGNALVYSTYLGGTDQDIGFDIAVDAAGAAYVTGITDSTDYPTVTPYQAAKGANTDGFLAKLAPDATSLTYSTYFGGDGVEQVWGIVLNAANEVYIGGYTDDGTNFPIQGGFQATFQGGPFDGFVSHFDAAGTTLIYSSFLGGNGDDAIIDIALDPANNLYITGTTDSTNFPTLGAYQTALGGSVDTYVTKLDPTGAALVYSTYLGGNDDEYGNGLAVDAYGRAYVAGATYSTNYPVVNGLQALTTDGLTTDAFVTVFSVSGAAIEFSTPIGTMAGNESIFLVTLNPAGAIYVVGPTDSTTGFPITPGVVQATNAGLGDLFVAKIDPLPPPTTPPIPPTPPTPPTTPVNPGADVFEVNNTSEISTQFNRLTAGTTNYTNLTINRTLQGFYDQDWYTWSMPSTGIFTATLSNIQAGGGDLHVRIFVREGNDLHEIGSSTVVGGVATQQAGAIVTAGQLIYVWVYGYNFSLGTYDMALTLT